MKKLGGFFTDDKKDIIVLGELNRLYAGINRRFERFTEPKRQPLPIRLGLPVRRNDIDGIDLPQNLFELEEGCSPDLPLVEIPLGKEEYARGLRLLIVVVRSHVSSFDLQKRLRLVVFNMRRL